MQHKMGFIMVQVLGVFAIETNACCRSSVWQTNNYERLVYISDKHALGLLILGYV
jgi:hypothetical protein